jgi:RNA polymerase sigma-70 factor (ECF subfamily)
LRYASRLLRDPDRARDVVQDTFLRLCREEPGSLDGHLVAWLFTVCRNRALDLLRKEGRFTPLEDGTVPARSAPGPTPDRALEEQEALEAVREVLARLPASQREALQLKFNDGLSYKEISAVTGFTVSHVGVLIHDGLKAIRARLGPSRAAPTTGRTP